PRESSSSPTTTAPTCVKPPGSPARAATYSRRTCSNYDDCCKPCRENSSRPNEERRQPAPYLAEGGCPMLKTRSSSSLLLLAVLLWTVLLPTQAQTPAPGYLAGWGQLPGLAPIGVPTGL